METRVSEHRTLRFVTAGTTVLIAQLGTQRAENGGVPHDCMCLIPYGVRWRGNGMRDMGRKHGGQTPKLRRQVELFAFVEGPRRARQKSESPSNL